MLGTSTFSKASSKTLSPQLRASFILLATSDCLSSRPFSCGGEGGEGGRGREEQGGRGERRINKGKEKEGKERGTGWDKCGKWKTVKSPDFMESIDDCC